MITICPVILVFQSRLNISSSNPIIEMITAHIPIITKSWSALPRKKVVIKKATRGCYSSKRRYVFIAQPFLTFIIFFLELFCKMHKTFV